MSLPPWLQAIISSSLLIGLGALFLRNTIRGWVTRQFEKESQTFQHGLDKQLEAHKTELQIVSKRQEKAQELEFTVLPRLVTLMQSAAGAVADLINATWRTVYDLHDQPEDLYRRWVETLPYYEEDKAKLRTAESKDRNALYKEMRFRYERADAKKKCDEFHNHLLDHGYMLGSLSVPCYELDNLLHTFIWKAAWENETHKPVIDYNEWNAVRRCPVSC